MFTGHAALLLLLLLSAAASSSASNQARSLFQYEGKDDDPPAPPPPAAPAAASSASKSAAATAPNITQLAIEVQRQIREPAAQIINLNTEFSSGGSSISVGEADEADRLMVQVWGGVSCVTAQGQSLGVERAIARMGVHACMLQAA